MTRSELAKKVMLKLGLHDKGNSLDPEDQENILDAYDSIYQELKDDGLVTWAQPTATDSENIPERFMLSLSTMTAAAVADYYKLPESTISRLVILSEKAKHTIRRQLANEQVIKPVEAEYF